MIDKKMCKYCPSGDKGNKTEDGHYICLYKMYGGECKFDK